jgi:folate-binding Fe-S cluster repair protein YgfZ
MLANFVLWRESGGDFRALLPGDLAAPIAKRLAMFVLRSKVTVADVRRIPFASASAARKRWMSCAPPSGRSRQRSEACVAMEQRCSACPDRVT